MNPWSRCLPRWASRRSPDGGGEGQGAHDRRIFCPVRISGATPAERRLLGRETELDDIAPNPPATYPADVSGEAHTEELLERLKGI